MLSTPLVAFCCTLFPKRWFGTQDGENWDEKYIERIANKAKEAAMRRALVKQKQEEAKAK